MKIYSILVLVLAGSFVASSQNQLAIPDTMSGPVYNLTMHRDSVQFFPGKKSLTYAFNTNKYLGPTLIFKKGTNVSITVNNQVGDTTTVHWHGIHLPAKWDGGPHTPILPNGLWNPQFTVMDHSATYWYHPHMHMKTALQAIKGAAGLIIVRDSTEAAIALPRKYGVDDIPLVVQCQQYDSTNQAMPKGMQDSTLLVNGTMNPYVNVPAQVIRMRLLNASGERTFNFGFTGNKQFYQIASDGGLLSNTFATTRIRLSPGERAEILINLTGLTSQTLNLMCYGSELPIGVQGGPTMPMPPGYPPMNSPLNGIDYNILKLNVGAPTSNSVGTIPTLLVNNTVLQENQANVSRKIRFTADSLMVMDGPFYFNDSTFDMMRIDYRIPLNSTEKWTLVNKTMVAHPFHLHDAQFFILNRNGVAPGPDEKGRKDVVLVLPDDSVTFITKFQDFSDEQIPYMYHCHILMHEDDGMMGQFIVSSNALGLKETNQTVELTAFPNPANGMVTVVSYNQGISNIETVNYLGTRVMASVRIEGNKAVVDLTEQVSGIYTIIIITADGVSTRKIIKQ